MKLDSRKDFQPDRRDPQGSPEFREDFQLEGADPAGTRLSKPHGQRAGGTVADIAVQALAGTVVCVLMVYIRISRTGVICIATALPKQLHGMPWQIDCGATKRPWQYHVSGHGTAVLSHGIAMALPSRYGGGGGFIPPHHINHYRTN